LVGPKTDPQIFGMAAFRYQDAMPRRRKTSHADLEGVRHCKTSPVDQEGLGAKFR
jgi:hypothetical protein